MRLRQVIAHGAGVEGGDPLFELRPVWMASPETVAMVMTRRCDAGADLSLTISANSESQAGIGRKRPNPPFGSQQHPNGGWRPSPQTVSKGVCE